MAYLDVFLVSMGGATTLLVAVAYLAKKTVLHFFHREMESYKAKLSHSNNIELEKIKAELKRSDKIEDRALEYEQIMKRYQGPLLYAVYDLQSRLYNIIVQGLTQKYYINGNEYEKKYVINNTVFVIAQYFAWTEIIRQEVQFIDFQDSQRTQKMTELRDRIYTLWQTEKLTDPPRIWAGEQRAIGELMIEEKNGALRCMGYAAFLKKMSDEPLLTYLKSQVINLAESPRSDYPRLKQLQHALIDVLDHLDPDCILFPKEKRYDAP